MSSIRSLFLAARRVSIPSASTSAMEAVRCLSTTSMLSAAKPRKSPSSSSSSRSTTRSIDYSAALSFSTADALPPVDMLKKAHKAGVVDLKPDEAIKLLREYIAFSQNPEPGWEKRVCLENKTSPKTLTRLALLLGRNPEKPRKILAKKLLLSASSLGHVYATNFLIRNAQHNDILQRPEYVAPFARLQFLANQKDNVESMVIMGKILLGQRKENQALELFRQISRLKMIRNEETKEETYDPNDPDAFSVSEALVAEGDFLQVRRDIAGAEDAFRKAALQLDSAPAYYRLAMLLPSSSPEKETYLLKAAASDIPEARQALVDLYTLQEKPGLAEEWAAIGQYSDNKAVMV